MTGKLFTAIGLAAVLLAACGQTGGAVRGALIARAAGLQAGASQVKAIDGRTTYFAMISKGYRFVASPIEVDGDVTVWAALDGTQLAVRNGMLLWTRGFGPDLMSAQVPSLAELIGGADSHRRVYHFVDGADSPRRLAFDCTVTNGNPAEGPSTKYHLVETCDGEVGRISNEFWIDSGLTVVETRQWLSEVGGYVSFRHDGQ